MNWKFWSILGACLMAWLASTHWTPAAATPLYAVRSPNRCDTCHVEPVDWANPAVKDRKCSLDCTICHVSPTGGGLRTPSGQYYGREVLPRWGERPSIHATSDDNAESAGYYRFFGGFGGWQAGNTPSSEVEDRYGDIEPNPTFRGGGDIRIMTYIPANRINDKFDVDPSIFPMQASLYLMGRPHENVVLYGDMGLMASEGATNLLGLDLGSVPPLDYLRVRELFVKVDNLPYNTYVRAGRFNPAYGWRIPDHTAYIRKPLGFDQDRQVFGIEGGINPNYPYANLGLFAQGLDAWPGDTGAKGWGLTANGGIRELGWHLGGSAQFLSTELGDSLTLGPQWALNFYPVAILGELDLRQDFTNNTTLLAGYSEVNWLMTWGLTGHIKFEYIDPDVTIRDDHQNRVAIGTNFHPWTQIDIQTEYRQTWSGGSVLLIGSELTGHEVLIIAHAWF